MPDDGTVPRSPGSRTAPKADQRLVRALLRSQVPALADRPLRRGPTGWDNAHWLLGEDLAVRLPRRRLAASLVANEASCLPQLAPRLPLDVPVPVHVGEPQGDWPWPWSVVPWFAGERSDLTSAPVPPAAHARALGTFLAALHVVAPADAPYNPYRSTPLADRAARTDEAFAALEERGTDDEALPVLRAAWDGGLAAPVHEGPPVWIHGDLHPGNQLVRARRLTAVVDWGDVAAGDPAADLATAWWSLPTTAHAPFRAAYGGVEDAMWSRAMGWAAAIALYLLKEGPRVGDAALVAMGERTVERLRASLAA